MNRSHPQADTTEAMDAIKEFSQWLDTQIANGETNE